MVQVSSEVERKVTHAASAEDEGDNCTGVGPDDVMPIEEDEEEEDPGISKEPTHLAYHITCSNLMSTGPRDSLGFYVLPPALVRRGMPVEVPLMMNSCTGKTRITYCFLQGSGNCSRCFRKGERKLVHFIHRGCKSPLVGVLLS